jgi:hypothetical protein
MARRNSKAVVLADYRVASAKMRWWRRAVVRGTSEPVVASTKCSGFANVVTL